MDPFTLLVFAGIALIGFAFGKATAEVQEEEEDDDDDLYYVNMDLEDGEDEKEFEYRNNDSERVKEIFEKYKSAKKITRDEIISIASEEAEAIKKQFPKDEYKINVISWGFGDEETEEADFSEKKEEVVTE